MNEKNQRPRHNGGKQCARFSACLLAITIIVGSVPGKVYAKKAVNADNMPNLTSEQRQEAETNIDNEFLQRLAKAKEELTAYMKSFNRDVIDNPAIEYQDKNVKDDIKKAITRADELLAKQDINQDELEEMEKIPYKKVNGKKSGLFRDFTKKALVNYEVLGDKNLSLIHI